MLNAVNNLLSNKNIKTIILFILGIMAAVSVYKGCVNAVAFSQDFQWDAAKALSMGINPYDESLAPTDALNEGSLGDFYSHFEGIGAPQRMEANQFPSLLMLLMPYTLMQPDAARLAWMISNLIFTALIIWLLKMTFLKDLNNFMFASMALLMLAGTPFRNQLGVGQHTLFAFAFFLLAVYCSEKKGPIWCVATIVSLFISYFKYTLTAPLVLYFVYKKKYKEIIISIAAHGAFTVMYALILGNSVMDMILKPLKVASVLSSEGGLDLGALLGGGLPSYIAALVVAILLFVCTLRAPSGCANMIFAVSLLWSLILTYHRTYDFFVLIAASTLFAASDEMPALSERDNRMLSGLFLLTVLMVFFVLRIFSENTASKLLVGAVYYIFTIMVTVFLIRMRDEQRA